MERKIKKENYNKIIISGTLFIISENEQKLIKGTDKTHVLPYSDMQYDGSFFSFIYNKDTQSINPEYFPNNVNVPQELERIKMPVEIAFLQDHSMNHYDSFNLKSKQNGWGFALLGKEYDNRMLGNKPAIILVADIYEIDIEKGQLINIVDRSSLNLADFSEVTENGINYLQCNYDAYESTLVKQEMSPQNIKPNIVRLLLPPLDSIDPVGRALMESKPSYRYLNRNPSFQMQTALIKTYAELKKQNKNKAIKGKGI